MLDDDTSQLAQLYLAEPALELAELSLDRLEKWRVAITLTIGAGQAYRKQSPAFDSPGEALDHAREVMLVTKP